VPSAPFYFTKYIRRYSCKKEKYYPAIVRMKAKINYMVRAIVYLTVVNQVQ
jgi:hypothetical protein